MTAGHSALPLAVRQALEQTRTWGLVEGEQAVAFGAVDGSGVYRVADCPVTLGDTTRSFRIASVSKLLAAYAALIAVEEGTLDLDEPAGPPESTVRHLLAHAAGFAFDGHEPVTGVGRKRIYSNTGIERFAEHLASRTGVGFADYLTEAVLQPLGMQHTALRGSPAYGIHSTVDDLSRFAVELLRPTLISPSTLSSAVTVQFPGLAGIVPGVGRFDPCDWGLGFELNAAKPGHWTGSRVSRLSFGHFGGSGAFLLVDPTRDLGIVCLTNRDYGPWALAVWPPFIDALVDALDQCGTTTESGPS